MRIRHALRRLFLASSMRAECLVSSDPQKWRRPLCRRIFFMRSRLSRSLVSRPLETTWVYLPSLWSFWLLRNQVGMLNCRGCAMISLMASSSSSVISPARLFRSTSAYTQHQHKRTRGTRKAGDEASAPGENEAERRREIAHRGAEARCRMAAWREGGASADGAPMN